MANKNSGSNSGGKAASTAGKGRPTPKRNANNKKAKVQESRNANRQWYMVAAVLIAVVAAILILGTIFGDPYEPLQTQQDLNR